MMGPYCVELCAGGGGQALGLEQAGFQHAGLYEIDSNACATLRWNRSDWNVTHCDICELDGSGFRGIDLLAGGLPCPPFSVAGKQLGFADERDLFPAAMRLVGVQPSLPAPRLNLHDGKLSPLGSGNVKKRST